MKARLAVLGNPVTHSRSPEIHGLFALQSGVDLSYEKIEVPAGCFRDVADTFLKDGTGFNVTVPCKFDAFEYVDLLTDQARRGQAVNTVSRAEDGRILGSNTDGAGLVKDLKDNLNWTINGRRILVLGAGGAVSGVLPALLEENPKHIHLYNRTPEKARTLCARLDSAELAARGHAGLETGYDLVINGTSASLTGEMPDLPAGVIGNGTCCYDMVYSENETAFNHWCRLQAKCETSDGLGMLVEQAALSFQTWFSREADTSSVLASLRSHRLN